MKIEHWKSGIGNLETLKKAGNLEKMEIWKKNMEIWKIKLEVWKNLEIWKNVFGNLETI